MRPPLIKPLARLCAAAAAAIGLVSCADLVPLEDKGCGNYVVEEDKEDCDTHAPENAACGQPGEAHECRFICDAGSLRCPTGFGCGHDGVCRRPSGSFETVSDELSLPLVQQMKAGDFDGDGLPDILAFGDDDTLGRRPVRLVYAPGAPASSSVVALPVLVGSSSLNQLDADGNTDMAYADGYGISVFHGRADHQPAFDPFPAVLLPSEVGLRVAVLDARPDMPGDELIQMIDRIPTPNAPDAKARLVVPAGTDPEVDLIDELPGKVADLAGDIVWGKLDKRFPCPQIVLPFTIRGYSSVRIFTPCQVDENQKIVWGQHGEARTVKLQDDAVIDTGVQIVDLNHDGHLDLLIGASKMTYVAWGAGDGSFTSLEAGGQKDVAGKYTPLNMGKFPESLLAAGDLNADGMMDFVTPTGVYVSHPGSDYTIAYTNLGQEWTVAVVADLNANGLPDVIAGSSSTLDLDFLNNAGGGVLNPAAVPTNGPPGLLAVGDFDGDLVNDVAFTEESNEGGKERDKLAVAYGSAYGPPVVVGNDLALEEIDQITAGALPDVDGADGIADLVVVAQKTSGTSTTDAEFIIRGGSSRALVASLSLRSKGTTSVPAAVCTGHFGDQQPDIAVVGTAPSSSGPMSDGTMTQEQLRLWRVEGTEGISLDRIRASQPFLDVDQGDGKTNSGARFPALAAAGDLDRKSPYDEVVVLAAPDAMSGDPTMIIADLTTDDQGVFTFVPRLAKQTLPINAPLSTHSILELEDIDGDGALDVLLLANQEGAPGEVDVFWGDGNGGITLEGAVQLLEGDATGVACMKIAGTDGCEVIISTKDAVFGARTQRGSHKLEAEHLMYMPGPASTDSHTVPGGAAVVTGDFDGDGLYDFALSDPDGIQLYRSRPVLE